MTNKKIDTFARALFYFMPIMTTIIITLVGIRAGGYEFIPSFEDICSDYNYYMSWTNYLFTGFTTWLNTNLIGSNSDIALTLIYTIYYFIIVEFLLLIKNVMLFIFRVAEKWLHKGVDLV